VAGEEEAEEEEEEEAAADEVDEAASSCLRIPHAFEHLRWLLPLVTEGENGRANRKRHGPHVGRTEGMFVGMGDMD
jgi:hypothetical protein